MQNVFRAEVFDEMLPVSVTFEGHLIQLAYGSIIDNMPLNKIKNDEMSFKNNPMVKASLTIQSSR